MQDTRVTAYKWAYKWYVVIILGLAYAVSFLDRQVINILGQSIKEEMHISDAQLGLLTGTAFGVFYSLLGLPISRFADRTHRVNLITASLLVWSGFTAACGMTQSYLQLFMARLGVGIGEAGSTPPSQSLISDYFSQSQRTLAFSLFNVGVPFGVLFGFLLGGYINDWFGWRTAFVIAGMPGIVIAVLLKTTVREPLRGAMEATQHAHDMPALRETLRRLFMLPSYLWLITGSTFGIFTVYVTGAWLPPLFIRVHHFSPHQIGSWLALCAGAGGAIGLLGGGALAAYLRGQRRHGDVWVVIAGSLLVCPLLLTTTLADDLQLALTAMFLLYVFAYFWMGTMSARVQQLVPVRSRALAVGFALFLSSITALAFGPALIGWLSDSLAPLYGVTAIRYAVAWASVGSLCCALCFLMMTRYLDDDLKISTGAAAVQTA